MKTVLFDWDGTLMDTHRIVEASYRYALNKLGRPFDQTMEWYITRRPTEVFGFDEAGLEGAEAYREYYVQNSESLSQPFPGATELIEELKSRDYVVGVVTNKEANRARTDMKRIGILHDLDVIVTTEDTNRRKPYPDPLLAAKQQILNADEQSTLIYVGDNPVDVTAARLAGFRPIAALWGFFTKEALARRNPWKMARDISAVRRILADVT